MNIMHQQYNPLSFELPEIKGLSKRSLDEHIKLYEGYVKNANAIQMMIAELSMDADKNAYTVNELRRRFSFEFNGMRNHEIYFSQLVGGPRPLPVDSALHEMITRQFGSFDGWVAQFTSLALTRGIGWAMLSQDLALGTLIQGWVDEQHLGQLAGTKIIFALDMWEHSYVADYMPSGKKQYVTDYIAAVNWEAVSARFS
jgi:Fe-Mn family superoxide dismutase